MRYPHAVVAVPAAVCLLAGTAGAQLTLPCVSTFDSDTIGMLPTLGVPDCPSSIHKVLGTEGDPIVLASSLGIVTQPVQFTTLPDGEAAAMLLYDFAPNVTTVVRAEATISVGAYMGATVMRSWENSVGLVLGDIRLSADGLIRAGNAQLGSYTPGVPFRIRMDVNVITGRYAAIADDELNGFADDLRADGLTFPNDPALVDNVGGIGVGYNWLGGPFDEVTVAVDDVRIFEIPGAGTLALLPVLLPGLARRRR